MNDEPGPADDAHADRDAVVAAGLYDPLAPDAAARLALYEYLLGLGLSIPLQRPRRRDARGVPFAR
ncbi:MAG TPA: hypothetical protein VIK61_17375 [Acidimicrobiia bacterium]